MLASLALPLSSPTDYVHSWSNKAELRAAPSHTHSMSFLIHALFFLPDQFPLVYSNLFIGFHLKYHYLQDYFPGSPPHTRLSKGTFSYTPRDPTAYPYHCNIAQKSGFFVNMFPFLGQKILEVSYSGLDPSVSFHSWYIQDSQPMRTQWRDEWNWW